MANLFFLFDLLYFVLKGDVGGFHLLFHIPIECKIDVIILHMVMCPALCGTLFLSHQFGSGGFGLRKFNSTKWNTYLIFAICFYTFSWTMFLKCGTILLHKMRKWDPFNDWIQTLMSNNNERMKTLDPSAHLQGPL